MRVAVIDEREVRAAIIRDGLAAIDGCEVHVITERHGLIASIAAIAPDIVLMDLGNPSRDVLEEYFAVSRALARPIAMFVDESDDESIAASIDAGVSAYVVDGLAPGRIKPLLDLAVRRFEAFSRLQGELAEARGRLAEREAIDRAKRTLMQSEGIDEAAAYSRLRRHAMNTGKRIAEVAEAVVTASALMQGEKMRGSP
jgi:two-component system, response regulator / RNA-binding antiterminator